MKKLAHLLLAICLVGCGTIGEELPSYEESSIISVGDYAPDFSATTLDGDQFSLSAQRGDVVLLVLFSHTCPDCKALFDDIMQHKATFDAMGAEMVAVSRGGTKDEIEEYMQRGGYDFVAIADSEAHIFGLYATTYVPRTYLINQQGVVEFATIEYESTHLPQIIEQIGALIE